MAILRCKSQSNRNVVAKYVVLATAALYALPGLASTPLAKPCPSSEPATLQLPPDVLVAATVSHDAPVIKAAEPVTPEMTARELKSNLLAPRAEAAIREAFDEEEIDVKLIETVLQAPVIRAKTEIRDDTETETPTDSDPAMKTALPGVDDDELSRFKKLMYRRDI